MKSWCCFFILSSLLLAQQSHAMAVTMKDIVCTKNQQSPHEGSHFTLYQDLPPLTKQASLDLDALTLALAGPLADLQIRSSPL